VNKLVVLAKLGCPILPATWFFFQTCVVYELVKPLSGDPLVSLLSHSVILFIFVQVYCIVACSLRASWPVEA
jgi:hypothetical protein